MKNRIGILIYLLLAVGGTHPLHAEEPPDAPPGYGHHGRRHQSDCQTGERCAPRPFGDYCPSRHADHYGARQPVTTEQEARQRLALFFHCRPDQVFIRRELRMGYIADITSNEGERVDRVIIDKRSGRIRSIR